MASEIVRESVGGVWTTKVGSGGAPDELTADELAAIQGAAAPDAGNVFATMADVGGGTDPATLLRGVYSPDSNLVVADTEIGAFAWEDEGADGGPVFDLTNPTQPAAIVAGVYCINVTVSPNGMTADGYFSVILDMDFSGEGLATLSADSRIGVAGESTLPEVQLTGCYYLAAGATVRLQVRNLDGAASRTFFFIATAQRVA